MNNNFFGNGQPGGWQTPPQGYNPYDYNYVSWYQAYNEKRLFEERKNQEKKRIKRIGTFCGIAALLYVVLAYALAYSLLLLAKIIPGIKMVFVDTTASFAFDIITSVISLGLPFVISFALMKRKKIVSTLPYERPKALKPSIFLTMVAVPTMVISSVFINYISAIFQLIMGVEFQSNMGEIKILTVPSMFLAFISIGVVPAIVEEFAIRGTILQPLRRYGDKFAIVVSALFFSLLHGNMFQIPYTFLGGLILGYLAVKTKSMWPPMVLHFINNGYSVIVMIVSDRFGDNWGNLSAYLMWVVFIAIGIIGAIGYMITREKERLSEGESVLKIGEKITAFISNIPMVIMIIVFVIMASGSVVSK